ncbi:unnamed protein product [Symbiodinium sp. CCMP2456]|nr:unnamed protein product [Symbiodinium sp. CCMP2456]
MANACLTAAVFLQVTNLPLILTSFSSAPTATGFGIGLMLALAGLTTTSAEGAIDEQRQVMSAKSTMVATSCANRAVRVSKGLVDSYAAIHFAAVRKGASSSTLHAILTFLGVAADGVRRIRRPGIQTEKVGAPSLLKWLLPSKRTWNVLRSRSCPWQSASWRPLTPGPSCSNPKP